MTVKIYTVIGECTHVFFKHFSKYQSVIEGSTHVITCTKTSEWLTVFCMDAYSPKSITPVRITDSLNLKICATN